MKEMTDRVGQQLGNYSLIKHLGQGGFATVYLGEHMYLKTLAAIKILDMQLGDQERDSFLEESRIIAHLSHPHIVRVLDFGMAEMTPYLVMEYAPNGSLRDRYPKGTQLPLATIVPYITQIASALQYAHGQNLIHRDVKPGNFLLVQNNQVLLSDFGVATVAHSSLSQRTEDIVAGTVAYMAPEQLQGKPRPASDQYSLAVVAYEWLCGELPFRGSLAEIISQQMAVQPPSLNQRQPSISPDVEEAVMVALSKDPRERFATVEAFANALAHANQPAISGLAALQSPSSISSNPYTIKPSSAAQTPSTPRSPLEPTVPASPSSPIQQQVQSAQPVSKKKQRPKQKNRVFKTVGTMLGGAIIFAAVILLSQYTAANKDIAFLGDTITISFIIACVASSLLPYIGALYGPLVGLFTGAAGVFIVDVMGGYLAGPPELHWVWYVGCAFVGLLAGLVGYRSRGYRKKLRTIIVLDILGMLSVNFGFLGLLLGPQLLIAAIVVVSILHLLLLAYNRRVNARKEA